MDYETNRKTNKTKKANAQNKTHNNPQNKKANQFESKADNNQPQQKCD